MSKRKGRRHKRFGSGDLGALLLRRFSRAPSGGRSATRRTRARTSPHVRFHPQVRFRKPASPKPIPPTIQGPPASPPTPLPAAVAAPSVVLIPAPSVPPSPSVLSSLELIRPRDSLKQSIEGFLLDQRSPHTRRAYGKDLKRFMQFLAGRRAQTGRDRIDRTALIAYKDSLLSEGLEHTTVDRHLATLRSFFRWLVDDGIIDKNPAEGVRFLNPRKLSTTAGFSDEEVTRILKIPDLHTRTGSQHYAILMMLFYCGLRRSELCELRTSSLSIEREHRVVRLRGKGNSERLIVLVPAVWNALKHYFLITRKDPTLDQPLFAPIRNNRTGVMLKPLDPSMIFYIVRKYARLASVQARVSPHSCRATAISNARDHNVPDRAIQEFAGWASPDMITRYDKRRSAVEKSAAHAIAYGGTERDLPQWAATDTLNSQPTDT